MGDITSGMETEYHSVSKKGRYLTNKVKGQYIIGNIKRCKRCYVILSMVYFPTFTLYRVDVIYEKLHAVVN